MKCILFSLLFLWGLCGGVSAQRVISINNGSAIISKSGIAGQPTGDDHLGRSEQARRFDYNPQLKSLTRENVGDILLLDFFNDREYRATVKSVTRDCNGVTGIVATIQNERFGYCYISVSESGILINAELPESNAYFMATGGTGDGRLSEYKMSEVMKNDLGCDALEPPAQLTPVPLEPVQARNAPVAAAAGTESVPAIIKVLVVYTRQAKNVAIGGIESTINTAISKAKEAADNSLTGITFELAESYEINYTEIDPDTDLKNLTYQDDGIMDDVHDHRRTSGADLVMLMESTNATGGYGWVLNTESGSPGHGFALMRVEQATYTYTMVHEMGHNMGCGHHKEQKPGTGPGPGLYGYSAGWKGITNDDTDNICTVMTYANKESWADGSSYMTIPYFSNPNIPYKGFQIGDEEHADNARTLRQTKHVVANYSEIINSTPVPLLTDLNVNDSRIPGFNPNTKNYSITVTGNTVTIVGTAEGGTEVLGNVTNAPLDYGDNAFVISASVGGATTIYTIAVNHPLPSHASYTSRPAFGSKVEAEEGSAALNLNMNAAPPIEERTSLVMTAPSQTAGGIIMGQNGAPFSCHDNGVRNYEISEAIVKVRAIQTKDYTFSNLERCIFSIYKSDNISCSSFLGSNAYWDGDRSFYPSRSIQGIRLEADKDYYIRALWMFPQTWQISVSSGLLVESKIPAGMGYTYVAVDKSDNKIKFQNARADFTNLGAGNYTIYGIPYSTGSTPANFVGETLADISDQVKPSVTSLEMTVQQGLSGDATLSNLTVEPGALTPAFNAAILSYKVNVANDVSSITITATKNHTEATVTGDGQKQLNVGKNTFNIIVTAENGSKKTYSVEVTRDGTYSISYGSFTGGSVTANPETNITAGTPVTIIIHPDPDHKLATLETSPPCDLTGTGTGTGEGDTRTFNMPSSDVTITATFGKTQEKLDEEAVANAENTIRSASFTVAQQIANTKEAVNAWLVAQINTLTSSTGVTMTVSCDNFTPAIEGTPDVPAGTNGSFTFNVSLTKGESSLTITGKQGTITATPYTPPRSYTVTVGSHANGSITVNPSAPSVAGTLITLTVTPDAGYELVSASVYITGNTNTIIGLNNPAPQQYTFTMPDHDVTAEAEFQKTQAQLDREAVEAAEIDIEDGTFRIMQAMGNTEATVKDWLINTLKVLFGDAHGIEFRSAPIPIMGDVTLTALTPAIAGTETSPAGTNGSFRFTVALTRGATTLTAGAVEGTIIATPYSVTPLKRIELIQMGNLKLRLINTGNTATGDLTLTLTGVNADAFILPSTTISSLPAGIEADFELALSAGLSDGIYHATLTVSCEGITPVSADIAYTVKSTGNDNPQEQGLKARMQNGRLHVSGLTAGKPWRVYNFSGALIYHGVASDEEENIDLSVRGLYVVVSGSQSVKVMFR